jgi:hypothetical protein
MPESEESGFPSLEELNALEIKGDTRLVERMKYFIAVGAFMVGWSMLEYVLDLCVVVIYQHTPGGRKLSKKQPILLAAKLDLFDKAHVELTALKPAAKSVLRLSKMIRSIGEVRHLIAHSVAVDTGVPGVSEVARIVRGEKGLTEVRGKLATADIAKGASLIGKLLPPLMEYAKALVAEFLEKPKK